MHWRDPMPVIVPDLPEAPEGPLTLPGGAPVRPRPAHTYLSAQEKAAAKKALLVPIVTRGGVKHIPRPGMKDPEQELAKAKREPKVAAPKHDPKHIALARELRDRFLDQVNGDPSLLLPNAKYEVAKALPAPQGAPVEFIEAKALPAAA